MRITNEEIKYLNKYLKRHNYPKLTKKEMERKVKDLRQYKENVLKRASYQEELLLRGFNIEKERTG